MFIWEILKMADDSLTDISLDISKLKVPELKRELKLRGLTTTGNKNELIERLQSAMKSSDGISHESVDDLEEDLLNDDDDEHLDASESVILENDLDDSPKTQKRKIDESSNQIEAKSGPPKKVILNRNNSNNMEPPKFNDIEKVELETTNTVAEKKVIKLSELSAKERLEMRAKKFGVATFSVDAKRAVRAERFGISSTSSSSIKSGKIDTSVDILKQRAERFGGSVSTIMSSLENKEKLEKRKERFGIATNANGTLPDSEKVKQQRLERFKQPIK